MEILRDTPMAKEIRTNWREPVQALVPSFNEERARWTGIFCFFLLAIWSVGSYHHDRDAFST